MVFYFSGTGNTRWAAQQLAAATGEQLCNMADAQAGEVLNLKPSERIGFCFPVHGWQPPRIVRRFVERLSIAEAANHYAYALCTCGDSTGLAMKMMAGQLAQKGIRLQSCQSLVMPESYVCLPFMYTDKPARERSKIALARQQLETFIAQVVKRQAGYSQLKLGLTPWLFSHVIGAYFNRFMISDKKFTADADTCIRCGRCARECPVGDITFATTDGLPQWAHDDRCTCCLSCYHHCPVHAINYGRITRRRGQYYFGHDKQLEEVEESV